MGGRYGKGNEGGSRCWTEPCVAVFFSFLFLLAFMGKEGKVDQWFTSFCGLRINHVMMPPWSVHFTRC